MHCTYVKQFFFLLIFTFNLIYLYSFLTYKTISLSSFVSFFKFNFNSNKRPFYFALHTMVTLVFVQLVIHFSLINIEQLPKSAEINIVFKASRKYLCS